MKKQEERKEVCLGCGRREVLNKENNCKSCEDRKKAIEHLKEKRKTGKIISRD